VENAMQVAPIQSMTSLLPRLLLQTPEGTGVEFPLVPVLVALAGIGAVIFVSVGALRAPRFSRRTGEREPRRGERRPREPPLPTFIEERPEASVAPVYKKAPISIMFPMIKPTMPDVWGVAEKAVIVFRAEDRGIVGQREVPGLTATVGDAVVPLVFYRGEARLERTFNRKSTINIVLELKVKGERQVRKTTRTLKIVDYREEIAEMFAEFKDEASKNWTPLRHDATAWEIYDSILDARPKVSQVALRECVSCFEEAKFSNHPVGRPTYEKMVHAMRILKAAEA
jgi:hypothetical protein